LKKTGLKEKIELTGVGKYNLLEKIILERNFFGFGRGNHCWICGCQ